MKQRSAFTLIELLTVIGIVAVVAAILISAVMASRRKGYQTACASNLHQINQGLHLYVADYDETYPPVTVIIENDFADILKLPELKCKLVNPPPADYRNKIDGYAFNVELATVVTAARSKIIHNSDINYPSTTVSIAEAASPETILQAPDPYKYKSPYPYGQPRGWERHEGGANYAFCDGHVKWYQGDQVDPAIPDTNNGTRPSFGLGKHP